MKSCPLYLGNEKTVCYHDEEWVTPVHDDRKQFKFLMMGVMPCGLNWNMIIQEQEIFRSCYNDFNFSRMVTYSEADMGEVGGFYPLPSLPIFSFYLLRFAGLHIIRNTPRFLAHITHLWGHTFNNSSRGGGEVSALVASCHEERAMLINLYIDIVFYLARVLLSVPFIIIFFDIAFPGVL